MVEIDAVFEVEAGSRSVSSAEAEATEAPSPPLVDVSTFITRSDVEQVDSPSRLEVEPISRGASPASLICSSGMLQSSFCLLDGDSLLDL